MDICGIMVKKGDKKKERYLNFIYSMRSLKCSCIAGQILGGYCGHSHRECVRGSLPV